MSCRLFARVLAEMVSHPLPSRYCDLLIQQPRLLETSFFFLYLLASSFFIAGLASSPLTTCLFEIGVTHFTFPFRLAFGFGSSPELICDWI